MKKALPFIKIALLTSLAILLFQCINLLVIYKYVRIDLYAGVIALSFLSAGLWIRRPRMATAPAPAESKDSLPIPDLLTRRELQILQLIADGKTNKEIAAIQFVELSTVKTHVNNIYGKLSISNRRQARNLFLSYGENNT